MIITCFQDFPRDKCIFCHQLLVPLLNRDDKILLDLDCRNQSCYDYCIKFLEQPRPEIKIRLNDNLTIWIRSDHQLTIFDRIGKIRYQSTFCFEINTEDSNLKDNIQRKINTLMNFS